MRQVIFPLCTILACASAALAHTGVKNAAVKARMQTMSEIGDSMKVIGEMAKGKTAFDATAARDAAAAIARYAADTPGLFRAEEDDPKSEAKQLIWTNFDDFTTKSDDLKKVAERLSASIQQPDDLASALDELASKCRACHKTYREK